MPTYLLSTYTDPDAAAAEPLTDVEQQERWQRMARIEEEMKATGGWLFSGRLHDPGAVTVVRERHGERTTTDGPYVETKEHLAGFYVVEAPDLDAALEWAAQVSGCIDRPIEVWPFAATAR